MNSSLPLPPHYDASRANQVWRVPYADRAAAAFSWAKEHRIPPAALDRPRIGFLGIDLQNTFCLPEFELYVGGRSGTGAADDTRRLSEFLYKNLACITDITLTLDTHTAVQIFHSIFLVDAEGTPPSAMTMIHLEDFQAGKWRFNPAVAPGLGITPEYGQQQLEYYVAQLEQKGKYALTIWPYHAMLGGIGHALASLIEEAAFFHSIARQTPTTFIIKGQQALTEHYSAISPEVAVDFSGQSLGGKDSRIFNKLLTLDALIVAGQAKSHCVSWTLHDLLLEIQAADPALARKVYLLEDCTSAVVIPGMVDFTSQADAAYAEFATAGMHLVRSTDPLSTWEGIFQEANS